MPLFLCVNYFIVWHKALISKKNRCFTTFFNSCFKFYLKRILKKCPYLTYECPYSVLTIKRNGFINNEQKRGRYGKNGCKHLRCISYALGP